MMDGNEVNFMHFWFCFVVFQKKYEENQRRYQNNI